MSESLNYAAPLLALAALAVSAIVTPLVRALARRLGAVAMPRNDRWHRKPTAMLGGIAIFVSVMLTVPFAVERAKELWVVLGASTLLFLVGLIDDFLKIKPYQKLIGQIVGAAAVIYFGLVLPWTGSELMNIAITLLWLIGITNAVNMLDNMDGLSAGVAMIAAMFLGINFALNLQGNQMLALAAFAGALLGFLIYNHSPASIFMGDCGSLFIGFFLASTALMNGTGGGRSRSVVAVLAVPVLVLFVPIFDTTFVTLMRKLAGRAASQGGRDHTSHRLVALGLSEKHAVWMLYSFAVAAGMLSLFVRRNAVDVSLVSMAGFIVVLTFIGIHLGRVRVYEESELAAAREKPLVAILVGLTYKRRVFEVALDAILVTLSYYLAYAVKFGPFDNASSDWKLFIQTLPIVICVKLVTFLGSGVYRGIWRYTSLSNVIVYVRAVALAAAASVLAIVFAFRFDGFSRTVFVLDTQFLLVAITGSRFAYRILRRVLPTPQARTGRKVLIYGAGDGGELIFRELHNNRELNMVPVGFVDDDPVKAGRRIHGLRVYSADAVLSDLCRRLDVDEVLVSTHKITGDRLALIVAECASIAVPVSRANVGFQRLSAADFGIVLSSDLPPAPVPLITRHGDANLMHPPHVRPAATEH
jgi:UDP-GlcNAc:undecaprenyl-phosphate/decaprenyl-phosphate GlcNAc-1-phosphate transferase